MHWLASRKSKLSIENKNMQNDHKTNLDAWNTTTSDSSNEQHKQNRENTS